MMMWCQSGSLHYTVIVCHRRMTGQDAAFCFGGVSHAITPIQMRSQITVLNQGYQCRYTY